MPEQLSFTEKEKSEERSPPVKSWKMVTNQSNLFYMIAAGMIMPPKGFGKKYYLDTLCAFPGYLPLFPEHVSLAAIDNSVSEKTHLFPCIMNMELDGLNGPVKIISHNGKVKDVTFPEEVDSSCLLMLVPAPLPINSVKSIVFRSREDRIRCEKESSDFNNVDLSVYQLKVTTGDFSKLKSQSWPPQGLHIDSIDVSLDLPMAAGAIMGLLFNMSHRGDLAIQAGRLAFEPDVPVPELAAYPVISAMGEWLQEGGAIGTSEITQKLFWNIVREVSISKYSSEQKGAVDIAIDYLESMPSDQFDEKTRVYGERLGGDLRGILGLADSTISEIFERHPKPVSRALTLFVLRDSIQDLLDFQSPLLTEADYVHAAILFAARDGWIALSNEMREFPGLAQAVSHRMAAMSHRISSTKLDLCPPPARPQSLLELLSPESGGMTKLQNDAALYLAREMKWNCIETCINLGKGEYRLAVTSAGVQLKLDGDIKAVVTEVLQDQFKDKLHNSVIPAKLDYKVREVLKVAS